MSSVIIAGNTSGTVSLTAPSIAGTTTINLPATSGTMALTSDIAPSFASGTRLGFQQTSAPTGWTKDTTAAINDSMLRLVTGTASSGGTTAFSTWSAVTTTGATTLSTAQIPSHSHGSALGTYFVNFSSGSLNVSTGGSFGNVASSYNVNTTTGSQGGGGSHDHSVTRNLKYYDFIIAQKD